MTEERDIVKEQPAAEESAAGEPVEEALAEDAAVEAPAEEPDWKDLALRKAAELENVRKLNAQRVQKASRDGMRRVAAELLPALDDFERALAHAEAEEGDEEHHLTAGIRLVQQKMLDALNRTGIEQYSPKGEPIEESINPEVMATALASPAPAPREGGFGGRDRGGRNGGGRDRRPRRD